MAITPQLGLAGKDCGFDERARSTPTQLAASVWKELFQTGSRSEVESGKVARLQFAPSLFLPIYGVSIGSLNAQNIKAFLAFYRCHSW